MISIEMHFKNKQQVKTTVANKTNSKIIIAKNESSSNKEEPLTILAPGGDAQI